MKINEQTEWHSIEKLNIEDKDIISIDGCITEILNRIELFKIKTFYIIDDKEKLIGIITEGDIRRSLIKGNSNNDEISKFVNFHPKFYNQKEIAKLKIPKIINSTKRLPVINEEERLIGFFPKNLEKNGIPQNASALAIAPVRISFAGGGSDLNYWFDDHKGCVVNAAIQKYSRVRINRNYSNKVNITSLNTNDKVSIEVSNLEFYANQTLILIVKCLTTFGVKDGLDVEIFCDFEPGTGLGGSSSLVIATLKALSKIYSYQLATRELVELSYYIEREIVGISGGWQDQIISAFGGLCITNFENATYETFKISLSPKNMGFMNSQLFMSPVGETRKSSGIHEMQRKESKEIGYEQKMASIVSLANECAQLLGQGKIEDLGSILEKGWNFKRSLGDFISNKNIDQRYEFLKNSGAEGGRLLGAGMSGYLLVLVRAEKQLSFLKACNDKDVPIERVYLDLDGARII